MAEDFIGGNHVGARFDTAPAPTGTSVYLFAGVPLDGTQKNQLFFETKEDQEKYFFQNQDLLPIQTTFSYQRTQAVLRVDINAEKLYNYNYIAFRNEQYGNKWFYGFVTNVEYRNEETSYVTYAIDVWQTWKFDVKFMPSYVKQMHQKEFRPASDGTMVPYQRNSDEKLNYGNEYDIVKQIQVTSEPNPYIKWCIIVATVPLEAKDDVGVKDGIGSAPNGIPTPLFFYLTPVNTQAEDEGFVFFKTLKGDTIWVDKVSSINYTIQNDEKIAGKVVSITLIDWCPVNITGTYPNYTSNDSGVYGVVIPALGESKSMDGQTYKNGLIKVDESHLYRHKDIDLGNVYQYFNHYDRAKLMVSPYSVIELTDFKGHQMTIKPEYIHSSNLKLRVSTALSWTSKVAYSIVKYNESDDENVHVLWNSDVPLAHSQQNWDSTIYDNSSGDIPIATSAVAAYIQSNKNSINTAVTNFDMSANTSFNNSVISSLTGTGQQAGGQIASGALSEGGISKAGLAGVGVGIINNGVKGISSGYQQYQQIETSRANLIRSQDAKFMDITNMPPNIKGMGNNTVFESNNAINGAFLVFKQVKEEYAIKLDDYFKMFGYKANRIVNLDDNSACFHSRRAWNYVETENVQCVGHINSSVMKELKEILNNGVTLWHTDTAKILVGDYKQDNSEL